MLFFFTEFRQYNFTIQKLQSDLQNQVKRIQEEVIMHINVTGDQTLFAAFNCFLLDQQQLF